MYACKRGTRRGFFEGVYPPNNTTAHLRDPPSPFDSRIASKRDTQTLQRFGFMQNRSHTRKSMQLYAIWSIRLRSMRLIPPGGIMLMVSTRWRQMQGG
jgi:hypothetical protein